MTNDTDVIVTANKTVVDYFKDNKDIYKILIYNKINSECKENVDSNYDTLSEVIKDEEMLNTLHEFVLNKSKCVVLKDNIVTFRFIGESAINKRLSIEEQIEMTIEEALP